MDLAVFGPMPGRVSSWAIVAVLRLMGCGGGVFWARAELRQQKNTSRVSRSLDCKRLGTGRAGTACRAPTEGVGELGEGSMGVVFGDWPEEGGLASNLVAVTDENDLGVGGIEMAAGGG